MSSRNGFAMADLDTGYFDDAKVKALARRLIAGGHPEQIAPALLLHVAIVLGSWGEGRRITLDEALPLWWSGSPDDLEAELRAVGLVDDEGRIPQQAWDNYFGPAAERKAVRQTQGQIGGLMSSLGLSREEARAEVERRSLQAQPKVSLTSTQAGPKDPSSNEQPYRPSVRPSVRPTYRPAGRIACARTTRLPMGGASRSRRGRDGSSMTPRPPRGPSKTRQPSLRSGSVSAVERLRASRPGQRHEQLPLARRPS